MENNQNDPQYSYPPSHSPLSHNQQQNSHASHTKQVPKNQNIFDHWEYRIARFSASSSQYEYDPQPINTSPEQSYQQSQKPNGHDYKPEQENENKNLQTYFSEQNVRLFNIICEWFLLAIISVNGFIDEASITLILQWVEFGIYVLLAFGALPQLAYLKETDGEDKESRFSREKIIWAVIDAILIVSGILSVFLKIQPVRKIFKVIRVLKAAFLLRDVPQFKSHLADFLVPLSKTCNFLIPGLVVTYIYAVVGLYMFSGLEYSKCRHPDNLNLSSNWTYLQQVYLCGQRECPIINNTQYECLNPLYNSATANPAQLININQGNGLLHFSNIFYAILSTVKQIFVTGSSRLIVLYNQALPGEVVQVFFISYILFMSYVYINIFNGMIIANSLDNQIELSDHEKLVEEDKNEQIKSSVRDVSKMQTGIPEINLKKNIVSFQENDEETQGNLVNSLYRSPPTSPPATAAKRKKRDGIYVKKKENEDELSDGISIYKGKENSHYDEKQFSSESESPMSFVPSEHPPQQGHTKQKPIPPTLPVMAGNIIVQIIIIISSLNLFLYYHGMSFTLEYTIFVLDILFLMFLLLQIFVRLGIELKNRQVSKQNLFYLLVYLVSLGGIIYQILTNNTGEIKNVIVPFDTLSKLCRTFKYLRVLAILRSIQYFEEAFIIMKCIKKSLVSMRYMVMLWWLVILILSIMSYELFLLEQCEMGSQINHQGLYHAFIFTILTVFNEEWDYLMFVSYPTHGYVIIFWQLFTLVIGLMLISKYFMALLVKYLQDAVIFQEEEIIDFNQLQQTSDNQLSVKSVSNIGEIKSGKSINLDTILQMKKPEEQLIKFNRNNIVSSPNKVYQSKVTELVFPQVQRRKLPKIKSSNKQNGRDLSQMKMNRFPKFSIFKEVDEYKLSQMNIEQQSTKNPIEKQQDKVQKHTSTPKKTKKIASAQAIQSPSCCQRLLFTCKFQIKPKISQVLDNKIYLFIKIGFLLCEIGLLARLRNLNDYLNPELQFLHILFYITKMYFLTDMILDVTAHSLYHSNNPNSYLRKSYYNWINTLVCMIDLLSWIPIIRYSQIFLKIHNLICSLRVFCFIDMRYHKDWNMRITLLAILRLIPKVLNLLFIFLIIFLYFALVMLYLYKDEFYSCSGSYKSDIADKWQCFDWGGDWVQYPLNFSNIIQSLTLLFFVASSEGWLYIMQPTMNLNGIDQNPKMNSNQHIQIFFIIFFFIGNLILLNSFISLSIWNFKKLKDKVTGENSLKPHERLWLRIRTQISRLEPKKQIKRPQNCIRKIAYIATHHVAYTAYKCITFILYLVYFSAYTYDPEVRRFHSYAQVLKFLSIIISVEYILEHLANGIKSNIHFVLETAILLYAVFYTIYSNLGFTESESRIFGAILIACQCLRYLKNIDDIPYVSKLLNSIIIILPKTLNTLMILTCIFYAYLIIGTQLFPYLRPGQELNTFDQNFHIYGKALFALLKFSMMESPIQQIADASHTISPNFICFDIWKYEDFQVYGRMGCGNYYIALAYYLSFHIVYSLTMVSMIVTMIVEGYIEIKEDEKSYITRYILVRVTNLWSVFDPQGTGFIPYRQFWRFSAQLLQIYDGKIQKSNILKLVESKEQFLKDLALPIYINDEDVLCFQFREVIQALTLTFLKNKKDMKIRSKKTEKMFRERRSKVSVEYKKSQYNSSHVLSLIIIKSGLKSWHRKIKFTGLTVQLHQMINKVNCKPQSLSEVGSTD